MDRHLIDWLCEKGSPVTRLSAARLTGLPESEIAAFRQAARKEPLPAYWLEKLLSVDPVSPYIHGSKDGAFENSSMMVVHLGIREDTDEIRRFNEKILLWLAGTHSGWCRNIEAVIVAAYLSAMGYGKEKAVRDTVIRRVDLTYDFCRRYDYDIYVDKAEYPAVPTVWRHKPVLDPDLYSEGELRYPLVYDVYAFAIQKEMGLHRKTYSKMDAVIRYILTDEYQSLTSGYGLVYTPPGTYHNMGWSVHLPGWFGNMGEGSDAKLLWWLWLLSHFQSAVESPWFTKAMACLNRYGQGDGRFLFPANYMPKKRDGYYVNGSHMNLGEDRRSRDGIALESTLWMLRIMKNMEDWENENRD